MTIQYQLYRDIQNSFKETAGISTENTHSAPQIVHEKLNVISNPAGWRMAKGNFGLHQGSWYLEMTLIQGHCRVGFAQISANLQSYPGFDPFGYSYGEDGKLFHQAVARVTKQSELGYKVGDIVGLLITLPDSYSDDELGILESRKWNPSMIYEPQSVNEKEVEIWKKESNIKYFVNGKEINGFPMLYMGRYYPSVGLWKDSKVSVNCGPNFAYPLPNNAKPYCKATSAPPCIGTPYDQEEIVKLQKELLLTEAVKVKDNTNTPIAIESPKEDTHVIQLNQTPNKLKRKGGNHYSPMSVSPNHQKKFSPMRAATSAFIPEINFVNVPKSADNEPHPVRSQSIDIPIKEKSIESPSKILKIENELFKSPDVDKTMDYDSDL